MKGTLGSISTVGVVPACASLDCLTVFARSVADGAALMQIMRSASTPLDVWRREPMPVRVLVKNQWLGKALEVSGRGYGWTSCTCWYAPSSCNLTQFQALSRLQGTLKGVREESRVQEWLLGSKHAGCGILLRCLPRFHARFQACSFQSPCVTVPNPLPPARAAAIAPTPGLPLCSTWPQAT